MTNQEAINEICDMANALQIMYKSKQGQALQMGIEALENQKTGHWLEVFKVSNMGRVSCNEFRCSMCNNTFDYRWNYCPNCGAKME